MTSLQAVFLGIVERRRREKKREPSTAPDCKLMMKRRNIISQESLGITFMMTLGSALPPPPLSLSLSVCLSLSQVNICKPNHVYENQTVVPVTICPHLCNLSAMSSRNVLDNMLTSRQPPSAIVNNHTQTEKCKGREKVWPRESSVQV